MRFHENLVSSFIPDFVEIQRKSFSALLKKGLIKELSNRNPITNGTHDSPSGDYPSGNNHDLELFFYPQYYQLNRPECTPTTAILKSKSYSCKLYVPAQLTNRQTNEIKLQWVLLGHLPLMTKRGHFIINGCPRVVVNQLVRSPGIYYQELIDVKKKKTYYADLISFRGAWLRLEIDKKRRVWARMKKTPKISALVLLQALGFTREQIKTGIRFSDFLKNSYLKENHPETREEALVSLYEKSHQTFSKTILKTDILKKSQVTPIMGQNFLFRKFMNPRTYNLSLLGRMRLNKKFGLLISDNQLTLTRNDIFCAIDYLINLKHGLYSVDDIDHLKNRRVKASGELIQNQLSTGLIRLEKTIREKMKKVNINYYNLTIHSLITTKPINGALREFFGSSPLSQYLDQTNPLAEITHKRRVSSLGPGGISRETAGMAIRGIHPTHYGRICPIETPEGRNAGLVNSITIHARISSHGFLKTPFYNVYQGQIQKQDSSIRDRRPIYLSAEQEERVKIAPGDLKASKLNFLPISKIPIRIGKEYHRVSREQVEYIAMSPIQMISIATSLIPFLEHDDANRALMGSNMQRQAVPVILPERPIVGTGLEGRVTADSGHVVQSKLGGYVSYASGKKIVLLSPWFPEGFANSNLVSRRELRELCAAELRILLAQPCFLLNLLEKNNLFIKYQNQNNSNKATTLKKIKNIDHLKKKRILLNIQTYKNKYFNNFIIGDTYPLRGFVRSFDLVGKPFFRYKKVETNFQKIKDFRFLVRSKKNKSHQGCASSMRSSAAHRTLFPVGEGKVRKGVIVSLICFGIPLKFIYSLINLQERRNRRGRKEKNKYFDNFDNYLFQKTITPNNLTSLILFLKQQPYKFFNLIASQSSLINIIFISLNQESNLNNFNNCIAPKVKPSGHCLLSFQVKALTSPKAMLEVKAKNILTSPKAVLEGDVRSKSYGNRFFQVPDAPAYIAFSDVSQRVLLNENRSQSCNYGEECSMRSQAAHTARAAFSSYLSFKKSIIHSLRSLYKTNDLTKTLTKLLFLIMGPYITNGLQILTKKNGVEGETSLTFMRSQAAHTSRAAMRSQAAHTSRAAYKIVSDLPLKINRRKQALTKTLFLVRSKEQIALSEQLLRVSFFAKQVYQQDAFNVKKDLTYTYKSKIMLEDNLEQVSNIQAWAKLRNILNIFPSNQRFISKILKTYCQYGLKGIRPINENLLKQKFYKKLSIKPIQYSLQNYQRSNQDTCLSQRPSVLEGEWVQQGELLADCTASVSGDLSVGKNIFVAYMPWEGYNFEDAILISERLVYDDIYTSLHIERYELEIRDTKFGLEQISRKLPNVNPSKLLHLDEKGIGVSGAWVKEGDILIGKVTPIKKISLSPHEKLLYAIVGKKIPTTRNTSLRVPKGVEGKIINVEILETKNIPPGITFDGPGCVHIYLAQKRKIQVGDKISGRHGNKGIVSKIIPRQDMPYLPNGTPIDMVLNPLGVPSRMNVGQVFEALLGLAGLYLNQSFKIPSFDETYGPEASRSIIYSKLYEARLKSGQKWLFDPNFPGKTRVFDGRTGQCFDQLVTVGQTYMLKLIHLVDDKIHARSTGPYSLVTQQPLGGRSKHGGQRLGEMEVWALEGFGAAYTLQELLTIKSDDVKGRHQVINAILSDDPMTLGTPQSFKVLIRELHSLCLNLEIFGIGKTGRITSIDVMKLP